MERIHTLLESVLTLGAGRRCPGCGIPVVLPVCVPCMDAVQQSPPVADAAWHDEGVVGRLVRIAKRGDWRAGGRLLAHLVAFERVHVVPACDVITWVPADPARRARRGGHLPERFAKGLGAMLAVPVIDLLEAPRGRRAQRGLGRAERSRNVAGAFRARGGRRAATVPPGTRVLVVDDVRTTGATLAAARAALATLQVEVETMAIVGVDTATSARLRCLEGSSERGNSAHESNDACR